MGLVTRDVVGGVEQDGVGMAAWTTTWGLKKPVLVYVWVTVSSLEITVPLLSPKSQLKVMSESARKALGSWTAMAKAMARFWINVWSPSSLSFTCVRVTANGIWSKDEV